MTRRETRETGWISFDTRWKVHTFLATKRGEATSARVERKKRDRQRKWEEGGGWC